MGEKVQEEGVLWAKKYNLSEMSSTYLIKLQVKMILALSFSPCEKVMEYAIKLETCL
jgi:hypothetical protein